MLLAHPCYRNFCFEQLVASFYLHKTTINQQATGILITEQKIKCDPHKCALTHNFKELLSLFALILTHNLYFQETQYHDFMENGKIKTSNELDNNLAVHISLFCLASTTLPPSRNLLSFSSI